MTNAKLNKGMKVEVIMRDTCDNKGVYHKEYSEYLYTLRDNVEDFYNNPSFPFNVKLEDVKKVEDLDLYEIRTALAKNSSDIADFNENYQKRNGYNQLATKKDIEKYLSEDYVVAVKGIGRVNSIDEL